MSPVQTTYHDWSTGQGWNELSFSAEDRVRDSGGEDPADLHIAYEHAKAQVDQEAADWVDRLEGEPEYRVYVRVVREHRERRAAS